jgi:hypothetical protein
MLLCTVSAFADTQTLIPTADGTEDPGDWTRSGCGQHWQCVDEYPSGDDGNNIYTSTNDHIQSFDVTDWDIPTSNVVDSVRWHVRAIYANGASEVMPYLRIGSDSLHATSTVLIDQLSYTEFTFDFTECPGTDDWSDKSGTDLYSLEYGIIKDCCAGEYADVEQCWLTVYYTSAAGGRRIKIIQQD